MSPCKVHISNAGVYTTVQDDGRKNFLHMGVPCGGAFDKTAFQVGNWLVGNPLNTPAIEITGPGFSCRFDASGMIAVTGAKGLWKLNNQPIPMYESIEIEAADELSLGKLEVGYRSYLSIGGGLEVSNWLGSASAFRIHQSKVLPEGSWLQSNFSVRIRQLRRYKKKVFSKEGIPILANQNLIRVTSGPEFDQFSDDQLASFFQKEYKVSMTSNRMGLRLEGIPMNMTKMKEMISSGICLGTIQINNLGLPMLLGVDAQTMGGYPRIGVVVKSDMNRVAQLAPGKVVQFKWIDLENARHINDYQEHRLRYFFDQG